MFESGEDVALVVEGHFGVVSDHGHKLGEVEKLSDEHVVAVVDILEVGLRQCDPLLSSLFENLRQRRLRIQRSEWGDLRFGSKCDRLLRRRLCLVCSIWLGFGLRC